MKNCDLLGKTYGTDVMGNEKNSLWILGGGFVARYVPRFSTPPIKDEFDGDETAFSANENKPGGKQYPYVTGGIYLNSGPLGFGDEVTKGPLYRQGTRADGPVGGDDGPRGRGRPVGGDAD